MRSDDVALCMSPLVIVTPGWSDEVYKVYEDELVKLNDVVSLAKAIQVLIQTWKKRERPPVAMILETYHQLSPNPPALPAIGNFIPPERGIPIARECYESECRVHNREPNWAFFDRCFGTALAHAEARGPVVFAERPEYIDYSEPRAERS